jgi:hypothetical protein
MLHAAKREGKQPGEMVLGQFLTGWLNRQWLAGWLDGTIQTEKTALRLAAFVRVLGRLRKLA